jgi:argininosuccinate lyase
MLLDQVAVEVMGSPVGLSDDRVQETLDPISFIKSRVTQGSVRPEEVRAMLEDGFVQLGRDTRWLDRTKGKRVKATRMLRSEVDRYIKAMDPDIGSPG